MGSIKSVVNSVKKTVQDPLRLFGTVSGGLTSAGIGGALLGNAAGKKAGEMLYPEPSAPDFSTLQGQQGLQGELVGRQLEAAEQFNRDLPNYIQEEYKARSGPIEDQYKGARTNLMANLSNRGMLSSGHALKSRAGLEAGRAQSLGDLKAQTVQDAAQRAQAYRIDPLRSVANINEQNTRFQGELDALKRERDSARNALIGQGMGMVGSGLGSGMANINQNKSFSA